MVCPVMPLRLIVLPGRPPGWQRLPALPCHGGLQLLLQAGDLLLQAGDLVLPLFELGLELVSGQGRDGET